MEHTRLAVFGNASSVHRIGQHSRVVLDEAREHLARHIGAEPREIIITSGGTEANNTAIKGYALAQRAVAGSWPAIITAHSEHHAVLGPVDLLQRLGAPVQFVAIDAAGRTSPEMLRSALESVDRSLPPLVSIMHANNETGTINDIAQLASVAREFGALV